MPLLRGSLIFTYIGTISEFLEYLTKIKSCKKKKGTKEKTGNIIKIYFKEVSAEQREDSQREVSFFS